MLIVGLQVAPAPLSSVATNDKLNCNERTRQIVMPLLHIKVVKFVEIFSLISLVSLHAKLVPAVSHFNTPGNEVHRMQVR